MVWLFLLLQFHASAGLDLTTHMVRNCSDPGNGVFPGTLAFACSPEDPNGECFPFGQVYSNGPNCDATECTNLKDEECRDGFVKCDKCKCVLSSVANIVCVDRQINCPGTAPKTWLCLDGSRCILDSWVVDAYPDCPDESDENECNFADKNNCPAHSTCIDERIPDTFYCVCDQGYMMVDYNNGTLECVIKDECMFPLLYTCQENSFCVELEPPQTYDCQCFPGYTEFNDLCYLTNDCANPQTFTCPAKSRCEDLAPPGSYTCICDQYYRKVTENGVERCEIEDQCQFPNLYPCTEFSTCVELAFPETYRCDCISGYVKYQGKCYLENDCANPATYSCPAKSTCRDLAPPDSYTCDCDLYYMKTAGDICVIRDQCQFPFLYPCPSRSTCTEMDPPATYECTCDAGYTKVNGMCYLINDCASPDTFTCPALATCRDLAPPQSYICDCPQHYMMDSSGKCVIKNQCQFPAQFPCPDKSTCRELEPPSTYDCVCDIDYTMLTLNGIDACYLIDDCANAAHFTCPAHSRCADLAPPQAYDCICDQFYYKVNDLCQIKDQCQFPSLYPCQEHSQCFELDPPQDYQCRCDAGYVPVDVSGSTICALENDCLTVSCPPNSQCSDLAPPGTYDCICDQYYYKVNGQCVIKDQCQFSSAYQCPSNSHCVEMDPPETYMCECDTGYTSVVTNGIQQCYYTNDCDHPADVNCPQFSTCQDLAPPQSYQCVCNEYYMMITGGNNQRMCIIKDQCQFPNQFPCPTNSLCVELAPPDTYTCECSTGYVLLRVNNMDQCYYQNDCDHDPVCPDHSICVDMPPPATYSCQCLQHYMMQTVNGLETCDIRDQCQFPSAYSCPAHSVCNELAPPDTYDCQCNDDYMMLDQNGVQACYLINDCNHADKFSCPILSTCVDLPAPESYRCQCDLDYMMGTNSNGADECQIKNQCKFPSQFPCPLNSVCVEHDPPDDYDCVCNQGYTKVILSNGRDACVPVNDCDLLGSAACPPHSQCRNLAPPNSYECDCDAGYYKIQGSNEFCAIKDECSFPNLYQCPANSECIELQPPETYRCQCLSGYVQFGQICVYENDCVHPEATCPQRSICRDLAPPETYTCVCEANYYLVGNENSLVNSQNPRKCKIKNECSVPGEFTCPEHAVCHDLDPPETYTCACSDEYVMYKVRGQDVCLPKDDCQLGASCPEHSICIDLSPPATYRCQCHASYYPVLNQDGEVTKCAVKDECKFPNSFPCPANSRCVDFEPPLLYECQCNSGYVKMMNVNLEEQCFLQNDCANPANFQCPSRSTCVDIAPPGAYNCVCDMYYYMVGTGTTRSCQIKDQCQIDGAYQCPEYSTCRDLDPPDDYECICDTGYTMANNLCYLEDDCASADTFTCPLFSICRDVAAPSSYECICQAGYSMVMVSGKDECHLTNDCLSPNSSCPEYSQCRDLAAPQTYTCDCDTGYVKVEAKPPLVKEHCAIDIEKRMAACTTVTNQNVYDFGIQCGDGTCVKLSKYRNCEPDCNDGVDEVCYPGYVQCDGCKCVKPEAVKYQCLNRTVEKLCELKNLGNKYNIFTCSSGKCIPYDWVEDNECDCPDDDDEKCVLEPCNSLQECVHVGRQDRMFECQCIFGYTWNGFACVPTTTTTTTTSTTTTTTTTSTTTTTTTMTSTTTSTSTTTTTTTTTTPPFICDDGYLKIMVNGAEQCVPQNECSRSAWFSCPTNSFCVDLAPPETYRCQCILGYMMNSQNECIMKDECSLGAFTCPTNSYCIEKEPPLKYECRCDYNGIVYTMTTNSNGEQQCSYINDCDHPSRYNCPVNSVCMDLPAPQSYRCDCLEDYMMNGNNDACVVRNECRFPSQYNCPDNSLCVELDPPATYRCECMDSYNMINDQCYLANDCDGGGKCPVLATCIDLPAPATFECRCPADYDLQGGMCVIVNQCSVSGASFCPENSVCVELDPPATWECNCITGYEKVTVNGADRCYPINDCMLQTFAPLCPANAICQDLPAPLTYECTCPMHYMLSGGECMLENECSVSASCPTNSVCIEDDPPLTYHCQCFPEYILLVIGGTSACYPRNDCITNNVQCQSNAVCIDLYPPATHRCQCMVGYSENAQGDCILGDVCARKSCQRFSTCVDMNGVADCQCNVGYRLISTRNVQICAPMDYCNSGSANCPQHSTCVNDAAGNTYQCNCIDGYIENVASDGSKSCLIKNECDFLSLHNCPAFSNCIELEPPETFRCECIAGYSSYMETDSQGRQIMRCYLTNDCSSSSTFSCPANSVCRDLAIPDRYVCDCLPNYALVGNQCVTDNECSIPGHVQQCPPESTCIDLPRPQTFTCQCPAGYRLLRITGQLTCVLIDDCADPSNYNCVANSVCQDLAPPKSYICNCNSGYQMETNANGDECVLIDQCSSAATHQCPVNSVCIELSPPDTFNCQCNPGYEMVTSGGQMQCSFMNDCSAGAFTCPDNSFCVDLPSPETYRCDCIDHYGRIDDDCILLNECQFPRVHRCPLNSICIEKDYPETFQCECRPGYYLKQLGSIKQCFRSNDCLPGSVFCGPHSYCEDLPAPATYTCTCEEHYGKVDGSQTCTLLNQCAFAHTHSCPPNSRCVELPPPGSYECECNAGYIMINVGGANGCYLENDCLSSSCPQNSVCRDLAAPATYTCDCIQNYARIFGSIDCTILNECAFASIHQCPDNSDCIELDPPFQFRCECSNDFTESSLANGLLICIPIQPPLPTPDPDGTSTPMITEGTTRRLLEQPTTTPMIIVIPPNTLFLQTTLGFILDTTAGMRMYENEIRDLIKIMVDNIENVWPGRFWNFLIGTFDVTGSSVSAPNEYTTVNQFKMAMDLWKPIDNGQAGCPNRKVLTTLKLALQLCHKGCFLNVIVGGNADDYSRQLEQDILALVVEKRAQVNFVFYNDQSGCMDIFKPSYFVYQTIARMANGLFFFTTSQTLDTIKAVKTLIIDPNRERFTELSLLTQIFNYFELMTSSFRYLIDAGNLGSGVHYRYFPVDRDTVNITIAMSGCSPMIKVRDNRGTWLESGDPGVTLVAVNDIMYIVTIGPFDVMNGYDDGMGPGQYLVRLSSELCGLDYRVTGSGGADFNYKFAFHQIDPTTEDMRPALGVPGYVKVKLLLPDDMMVYTLHKVEYILGNGSTRDASTMDWSMMTKRTMQAPNDMFYVKLTGYDEIVGHWQRFSYTQITARPLDYQIHLMPNEVCDKHEFNCGNPGSLAVPRCVELTEFRSGFPICFSGMDEACTLDNQKCDGVCISKHDNCTSPDLFKLCKEISNDERFVCKNGGCVPNIWVSDNENDCTDNSDEDPANLDECEWDSDEFRFTHCHVYATCTNIEDSSYYCTCLPPRRGDGFECEDIPTTAGPTTAVGPTESMNRVIQSLFYSRCMPNAPLIDCLDENATCIHFNKRRDGIIDCPGGVDEECMPGMVYCDHGKCVRESLVSQQCMDKRIEDQCSNLLGVVGGYYRCRNGTGCTIYQWAMDGIDDCPDGSDENPFIWNECVLGRGRCGDNAMCLDSEGPPYVSATGKHICRCMEGFTGDGFQCTPTIVNLIG